MKLLHNRFVRKLSDIFAHLFHPRRSNNHRPRLLHPEGLFYLSLIIGGFMALLQLFGNLTQASNHVLGYASSITPVQVIYQINQTREQMGLRPLIANSKLSAAAQAKGVDMFAKQYWSHTSPDGLEPWYFMKQAEYDYQIAGENLARDFMNTDNMIKAWMASPSHRSNIVNSKYSEIGIAVIDGRLDGYETTLVVQMFGAPTLTQNSHQVAKVDDEAMVKIISPDEKTMVMSSGEAIKNNQAAVLASMLVPRGSIETPPLFTPLQLTKAFFLAVILMVISTLIYDTLVIGHRKATRLVGKNLAHVFVLLSVMYLVIIFKSGIIG